MINIGILYGPEWFLFSMDMATHVCDGPSCIFVVDTGEGLVCTKTGIVVGDVMLVNFDYTMSSTFFKQKNQNQDSSITQPSKMHNNITITTATSRENDDTYGECFRVVQRLLSGLDEKQCDSIVKRCVVCCGICQEKKIKSDYVCIAFLYLLREGLTVKGVNICEKNKLVAEHLPSLNKLANYGYEKSKFTKCSRLLFQSIDKAILLRPLHKLHL